MANTTITPTLDTGVVTLTPAAGVALTMTSANALVMWGALGTLLSAGAVSNKVTPTESLGTVTLSNGASTAATLTLTANQANDLRHALPTIADAALSHHVS